MQTDNMIEKELNVLTDALAKLKPSMDKPNRLKVSKATKESERTIYRYLCGEVANTTVAKKILNACKLNIEEREKELSAIAS